MERDLATDKARCPKAPYDGITDGARDFVPWLQRGVLRALHRPHADNGIPRRRRSVRPFLRRRRGLSARRFWHNFGVQRRPRLHGVSVSHISRCNEVKPDPPTKAAAAGDTRRGTAFYTASNTADMSK